jgi:hypothetical protein
VLARSSANAFVLFVAPAQDLLPSYLGWMNPKDVFKMKRLVRTNNSFNELFIGWARETDIVNKSEEMAVEVPPFWTWDFEPYYAKIDIPSTIIYGCVTSGKSPTEFQFWLDSDQSNNLLSFNWDPMWDPETGMKILVIMNLDGSDNIEADIQLGFKVPIFSWLPFFLFFLGIPLSLVGIYLIKKRNH